MLKLLLAGIISGISGFLKSSAPDPEKGKDRSIPEDFYLWLPGIPGWAQGSVINIFNSVVAARVQCVF